MNKVARSNWYMEQGMIFYNGHYYLPATSSPLLPDLLESLHATNIWLMAIGFYTPTRVITSAFPNSILLTRDWPQHILLSAIICFFDDNGRQFLSIDDIYISNDDISGQPSISPLEHNMGAMLFNTWRLGRPCPQKGSQQHYVFAFLTCSSLKLRYTISIVHQKK